MVNEPNLGGTRFCDLRLVRPVCQDGQLIAFARSNGHRADIAGCQPGSFDIQAHDHFGEGLRITLIRLWRRGGCPRAADGAGRHQGRGRGERRAAPHPVRECAGQQHQSRERAGDAGAPDQPAFHLPVVAVHPEPGDEPEITRARIPTIYGGGLVAIQERKNPCIFRLRPPDNRLGFAGAQAHPSRPDGAGKPGGRDRILAGFPRVARRGTGACLHPVSPVCANGARSMAGRCRPARPAGRMGRS